MVRGVPGELVAETVIELEQQFGAVSTEAQTIQGQWRQQGRSYRDDLTRLFVDVADTPEALAYVRESKDRLKSRFRQIDIWMTTYPVEVI